MKKKLSMVLTLMLAMSMLVGCVATGGPATVAAYQLKDVTKYELEIIPDPEWAEPIELSEEEYAALDVYTYEELAKCFVPEKIDASKLMEYFSFVESKDDEGRSQFHMHTKQGFYVDGPLFFDYDDWFGIGYYEYDPLNFQGFIASIENEYAQTWLEEKQKSLQLRDEAYIYKWVPDQITWQTVEGKEVLYVSSHVTDGDYTLIEEYEENELEISYMLHVIAQMGLLKQEEESTQTPEPGATEEQPEPSWSQPFMGKYYVGGSQNSSIAGIYIDEEYVYLKHISGREDSIPLSTYKQPDGSYSFLDKSDPEMPSGFSYSKNDDCFFLIQQGIDVGMLEKADKAAYDAIGTGFGDSDGMY